MNATAQTRKGPIAWMVHNRVTPNLLMLVLIVGGLFMSTKIKREVFPEFDLDIVAVTVAYPGASPAEVEQGIILAIEESVRAIAGIRELRATASEGSASVILELETDVDVQLAYQQIQQEIDRIRTLPEDAEEPQVSLIARRREVMAIQIYGDVSEWVLRDLAEQVREQLLQDAGITQVDLKGARNYEVHLEISQDILRTYGLTIEEVARIVRQSAVEVPGGGVKTGAGEILIRMVERRDWAGEFADIPIISSSQGTLLTLQDIATVRDGFSNTDQFAFYNGYPSIGLAVLRVGEQTPIGVSEAVRARMQEIEAMLPDGIDYAINRDMSKIYKQRLQLLLKNAAIGLFLVLLLLSLFLEFSLAFWVVMGIVTAFIGALLFLPFTGATINMVSMFAFIVALGIVVDDAIIAGENIYENRQNGMTYLEAAIQGAREIAVPVSFAIVTNIMAFIPILFVPGFLGKVWFVIPLVVITVFVISWVEALFILPAHIARTRTRTGSSRLAFWHDRQLWFSQYFLTMVNQYYGPVLHACLRARYLTVAACVALLLVVIAYVASGRMGLILMPKIESDRAVASAVLPYGSPLERVEQVRRRLLDLAYEVAAENGGADLVEGIFSIINENRIEVIMYLTRPGVRPLGTAAVTRLWREKTGTLPGLEALRFESDRGGPGRGPAVTVELSHHNVDVLDQAGQVLAERLLQFDSVTDVDSGFASGKEQLNFKLTAEGRSLGLTAQEVARQVRNAFYGAEALRQQRGRNEVKVMVRLPEVERVREYNIEELLIRTPSGGNVPLLQIAEVERGRAYATISRRDGRRTINVTAEVEPLDQSNQVVTTIKQDILPGLLSDYPHLGYSFEGRQSSFRESVEFLIIGFFVALICSYIVLAIPLRSYVQPVIVMSAIPFGIVGAVMGHALMAYNISIISMMGVVALAGVVVNDSLIMIHYANAQREQRQGVYAAIHAAGIRRFRPILLTTLTTFGGLAPMIFETSRQARFMIPMAISLGYGILFTTLIILVLVPCLYLIVEDIRAFVSQPTSAAGLRPG